MFEHNKWALKSIWAVIIISLLIIMLGNSPSTLPIPVLAETFSDSKSIDNSYYHSTLQMANTTSHSSSTPTIQAPLQIPRTLQSTDLVNSLAFYEVTFITSTTGAIDRIRMDFPPGTNVAAAGLIERIGIGGGTLLKSGSSITYDVTNPVSISAGTFIRLEMFGIKNPINPSTTFTAMITTRDSGGNLIDGPSQTNVYTIKQIDSNDVSESYMKKVILSDNAAGNALGWNPDGITTQFGIFETAIPQFGAITSFISIFVVDSIGATPENHFCDVVRLTPTAQTFTIVCSTPPNELDELHYVIENLPPHVP